MCVGGGAGGGDGGGSDIIGNFPQFFLYFTFDATPKDISF